MERQLLRSQAEESSALQGFLASWNTALEARLERQRSQCSQCVERLDMMEKRLNEEVEQNRANTTATVVEMQTVVETLNTRVSSIEVEMLKTSEDAFERLRTRMQEGLDVLRREIGEEVAARDCQAQQKLTTFNDKIEATETTRRELETVMQKVSDRLETVEQAAHRLHQEFDASGQKQASEVDVLRSC